MTGKPLPLIAGNWKMNGLRRDLGEIAAIRDAVASEAAGRVELLVCPPATLLMAAAQLCQGTAIGFGGQDCHSEPCGAFTGDISAEMLRDAGASYVIVGHSERRGGHGETNEVVQAKAAAGLRAGLKVIICVGETRAERDAGQARAVVAEQLAGLIPDAAPSDRIVIAYEPIWAIGTGLTPTPQDIAEVHGHARQELVRRFPGQAQNVRILYGGSVKPGNAAELLRVPDVDGALIGGASLNATDFMRIAATYRAG